MDENRLLMGIDEAGRGPVIGPMVITAVVADEKVLNHIVQQGLNDSKKLSPQKREKLFCIIEDEAEWFKTCVVWPDVIDKYVENKKLNILECDVFSELIDSYSGNLNVFIDSPLKPELFKNMLLSRTKTLKTLNCSFKADALYPVVSAASVVAKVTRDRIIETLKLANGDFGSGYPSDKKTASYIKSVGSTGNEAPYFVRRTWKTFKQSLFN
ncbi:MAG: ribonuclease HII [Pseudomonadota bacterium]